MKPAYGYPSKTAAELALTAAGASEGEIARKLGVRPNTVSSLIARARGSIGAGCAHIRVPWLIAAELQNEAADRETTPERLVLALLRAIVDDDLFAAVLDQ